MMSQIKNYQAELTLLPTAVQTALLQLYPPETKPSSSPPIVGGFQIPLPGITGDTPGETEADEPHDWHCYLGSR